MVSIWTAAVPPHNENEPKGYDMNTYERLIYGRIAKELRV